MPRKTHRIVWRAAAKDSPEWAAWVAEIEEALGRPICGACTRATDPGPAPCERSPLNGRNRCRLHGGASPIGPASPHWKDGARSKLTRGIPGRYLESFDEALADPELISCRHALSMLVARRAELYEQLDTGESGEAWKAVAECALNISAGITEAITALEERKPEDMKAAFRLIEAGSQRLSKLVQTGLSIDHVWKEIKSIGEHERKQRRQEQYLLEAHQHSIERERANALFMRLLSVMQASVTKHAPADVGKLIMAETSSGVNQLILAAAQEAIT